MSWSGLGLDGKLIGMLRGGFRSDTLPAPFTKLESYPEEVSNQPIENYPL